MYNLKNKPMKTKSDIRRTNGLIIYTEAVASLYLNESRAYWFNAMQV